MARLQVDDGRKSPATGCHIEQPAHRPERVAEYVPKPFSCRERVACLDRDTRPTVPWAPQRIASAMKEEQDKREPETHRTGCEEDVVESTGHEEVHRLMYERAPAT